MAERRVRHAALLAGGAGSRLGGGKPLTQLGGRPLIEWPLAAVAEAGLRAVVVAKGGTELPEDLLARGVDVLVEPAQPVHPLAGVATALRSLGGPVVAVACDLPFVPAGLIAALADPPPAQEQEQEPAAVVAPFWDGHLQPVLARYEPAALPVIEAAVLGGESSASAIERAGVAKISGEELASFGDPSWMLFDVDSPEDLARAVAHAAAHPDGRTQE